MVSEEIGSPDSFPLVADITASLGDGPALAKATLLLVQSQSANPGVSNFLRWDDMHPSKEILRLEITIAPQPSAIAPVSHPSDLELRPPLGNYLSQTLRNIMRGTDVIDTKFVLLSRRSRRLESGPSQGGQVEKPLAIFANSSLLSSVSDYFQTRQSLQKLLLKWNVSS